MTDKEIKQVLSGINEHLVQIANQLNEIRNEQNRQSRKHDDLSFNLQNEFRQLVVEIRNIS